MVRHALGLGSRCSQSPKRLAMIGVAARIRNPSSVSLRCLGTYLWIQAGVSLAGFLCVAFGGPWAYYHEYLFGEVVGIAAQCVLLYGVWRSFYPRMASLEVRFVGSSLVFLLAILSAVEFTTRIPVRETRVIIFAAHAIGYTFCAVIFAMTIAAWIRGCAWQPAAARCMLGFALTTAATFGIEQTEAVVGWGHWYLYYAPQFFYLAALLIWNSAISLDQPTTFTPAEIARIEAALAESMGIVLPPHGSTHA